MNKPETPRRQHLAAYEVLPASYFQGRPRSQVLAALRFWGLAGIGNILGGALLVALPFWYALEKNNG
jgi:formate/nitrite transporter FocA (FNT family)